MAHDDRGSRSARVGADSRYRCRGGGAAELDRPRWAVPTPAVRDRETRACGVGRRCPDAQVPSRHGLAVPAGAVGSGRRHPRRPRHARGRLRQRDDSGLHRHGLVLRCRGPAAVVRRFRCDRCVRGALRICDHALPDASLDRVPRPQRRRVGRGLAGHAGDLRPGNRRLVRHRHRGFPGEVGQPARSSHRLHLPGDR